MYPIDTRDLKRQIENVDQSLKYLTEKAEEVEREESARSDAFLGLMSDLRDLARELEFYAVPGCSLPDGGILGWAKKLRAIGEARFAAYLNARDGESSSQSEVAMLDDNEIRVTDHVGNFTTVTSRDRNSQEMSARLLARCMGLDVVDIRTR